ncbi:MAG: hypothetical protein A3F33_02610 [Candidatus Woykebacteria bacterium RIFCSPHIGHO2_12_FULL_43_10]|uniref:GTPase Obg n=2 Tax=Candidatus Woykeibacteriota TaxID=1817899 RepID=A0A1G1WV15_9BACT|nr:MAG: hypothetical protein A2802_00520 [Candidatus Woykebacteria bacterium RIFCSPHIGHO2_01_FULL_43_29]OGY28830.1 MAG: hypothetical protein A3J50_02410 [Candidatus Woykebacteria bacterium RIFCSPHIGHO2_02_FULL_43_16b]OGY30382.1 MAG: hypothetical protein A3F33_02610 [Candidatus Woykebacteria bacterium RIFCSPHIGHO2_12_FULL_43_10]OGY31554.1 MAG: hypothetical protein A3A61_03550 [Candidatus Woykebacteria bacterium RIFCSPLOWO2_01_FULL_43_14]
MIDFVKISVRAGNGGRGGLSFGPFHRGHPGKPEGGDGGKGGDVYFVADTSKTTLSDYAFLKHFEAGKGISGNKQNMTGAVGKDVHLTVPVGTLIRDMGTGETYDLDSVGKTIQIARGGSGGHGNAQFKSMRVDKRSSEYWDAVHTSEDGQEGELKELELELKLLADVGLVGLPNAGKSTLLSVLTAAKPKIANYPFTTLEPYLGVTEYKGQHMVLADIPGLIEGASKGKGLGTQFLKHIERTKILVHVISAENEDCLSAYKAINHELENFSEHLAKKPQIVVLNKIDIFDDSEIQSKIKQFKKSRVKVLPISGATKEGLEGLKKAIFEA